MGELENAGFENRIAVLEHDSQKNKEQHKEFYTHFGQLDIQNAVAGEKQTQIMSLLGEIKSDLTEMKGKPAKRWETVVNTILTTIAGGLIGALLMLVIKR